MAVVANSEQERFWNQVAGPVWVANEIEIEDHTRPFGDAALQVAGPLDGEAVLDVGCGCGSTTVALAHAVGGSGSVLGIDLSAPMLARAEQRASASAAGRTEFRRLDAQVADLGAAAFDLVFSRFGVMFFADPVAGFANLRRALRPQGRLVFCCWQASSANPWMSLVNRAALQAFDLPAPPPEGPGPFALADAARTTALLRSAGFGTVEAHSDARQVHLGRGQSLEDWVHGRLLMGPARPSYLDAPPEHQREVRATIAGQLVGHLADPEDPEGGLLMEGAAWVVHARP